MSRAAALSVVLALAACGHEEKSLSGVAKVAPPGGGAVAAQPKADPHGADPHARMDMTIKAPAVAEPLPVAWAVPQGWKETKPSSGMRLAQFDVGTDDAGDPVQCIVFGGITGSDADNISRWAGQMGPAAKDGAAIAKSERDGLKITRFAAHGSYTDTMRPGEPKAIADATMLAAIVEIPAGKLYVKLVGPKALIDGTVGKFDEFLASLKPK